MDLNKFYEWQQEKPQERWPSPSSLTRQWGLCVWVYDQTLMAGQRVHSVEEIDIEGKIKRPRLKSLKYEALRAKFELREGV